VSVDGSVYVASVEGYVHALGSDGSFRWSYGVHGVPLGPPAVDAAGRVYVATSEGRLYALSASGQLDWASSVRRPRGAPVWSGGAVYLVGGERHLYGIPGIGGASSSSDLGAPVSAALASVGAGLIAVGTTEAAALLYRRSRIVARIDLRAPLVQPLLGGIDRWFALTSEGLAAFDASSHALLWSAPARRAALSADERSLLVEADGELRWLSPRTGEVLGRAPSFGDLSAAPALTNTGVAVVPMVAGHVRLVEPLGVGELPGEVQAVEIGAVEVGPAPLWAPVHDEAWGRVTVAAGGSVVAFDLASPGQGRERASAGGGA
jgi:outer membrane protein assembly factor BamB